MRAQREEAKQRIAKARSRIQLYGAIQLPNEQQQRQRIPSAVNRYRYVLRPLLLPLNARAACVENKNVNVNANVKIDKPHAANANAAKRVPVQSRKSKKTYKNTPWKHLPPNFPLGPKLTKKHTKVLAPSETREQQHQRRKNCQTRKVETENREREQRDSHKAQKCVKWL